MKSRAILILFLGLLCIGGIGWWTFNTPQQKESALAQTKEEPQPGSSLLMIDKYVFKDTKRVYLYPVFGDSYAPSGVRATTTVANADAPTFSRFSKLVTFSTSEGANTYAYYKDKAHVYFFHDYDGIGGEQNTLEMIADADVTTFHTVEGDPKVDAQDKNHHYKLDKVVQ